LPDLNPADSSARSRWLETRFGRRSLLRGAAAGSLLALGAATTSWHPAAAALDLSTAPFTLGVASGDPLPDGVVLWTRLAPDPLNGGGMPDQPRAVEWELAEDDGFRRVIRRGIAHATPTLAHSVHVELSGLEPDRWYWYRFRLPARGRRAAALSPIGRTRTAPALASSPARLRFAFVSCQDYQNGYYSAYAALAAEDLDLVLHLRDYIYEDGPQPDKPRQVTGGEVFTLADYRNRYGLYKTDPALQAAHAAFPFVATWDDHEVADNYAGLSPKASAPPQDFAARRAAAYQAYYEHLPLRRSSLPHGPDALLYRRLTFGDLAEFSLLDTRQYRTDQPCGDGLKPPCGQELDEAATLTGPDQERWLLDGLDRSAARWNVIAQQVMFAALNHDPPPGQAAFNMDQWDGYQAARARIVAFLRQRQPRNPVVLAGDIHSSWVNELKADFANPDSATLGTELVGTAISSEFPPQLIAAVERARPANPHVKFFDGGPRGYVRCDLTPDRWQADFRIVASILTPNAPVSTLAAFAILDGQPGALPA
jgi:alkaline phosphatase D